MFSADVSKVIEELKAYQKDTVRRLENMVRGFSYIISQTAIENTPLGDAERYFALYQSREARLGLDPVEGFARGSWQVNKTGQFSIQEFYTVNSGSTALNLIKTNLSSYKLGDTLYIGNKGYYIKQLENNYSSQTNNLGIMQPTLDAILATYQVDLVRLFKEG
jgi:hypothetical protein